MSSADPKGAIDAIAPDRLDVLSYVNISIVSY